MALPVSDSLRDSLRAQFPALAGDTIFLENAGGSQVPVAVADRVRNYMLEHYVQLGASYSLSRHSTAIVDQAHALARLLMGGTHGDVVLGPSTSALLQMLAEASARILAPGDEVVVARNGHEANIGPWVRLERCGIRVRWWEMEPDTCRSPISTLVPLLGERTRIVAFPHVSNLLGEIVDVARITELVHAVGAKVVVDGVAYAPHRAIDVEAWGVDWYAFSAYKVYGPHMAVLWGGEDSLAELPGPNHFFIHSTPYRFELGGPCHESCAGLLGVGDYLQGLAGDDREPLDRAQVERAFAAMQALEQPLIERLLDYLASCKNVRIIGPQNAGIDRVGTISFIHRQKSSREIVAAIDKTEIAIRHGHMYAWRLCEALGLDPEDGVVRVSLVHYNTPREIERLIEVLGKVLG